MIPREMRERWERCIARDFAFSGDEREGYFLSCSHCQASFTIPGDLRDCPEQRRMAVHAIRHAGERYRAKIQPV